MYCRYCGKELDDKAYVCVGCGRLVNEPPKRNNATNTKYLAAGILGFFFGELGVHNFIIGRTTKGIIQLVMCILSIFMFIFSLVDFYIGPFLIILGVLTLIGLKIWVFIESIIILTKL